MICEKTNGGRVTEWVNRYPVEFMLQRKQTERSVLMAATVLGKDSECLRSKFAY